MGDDSNTSPEQQNSDVENSGGRQSRGEDLTGVQTESQASLEALQTESQAPLEALQTVSQAPLRGVAQIEPSSHEDYGPNAIRVNDGNQSRTNMGYVRESDGMSPTTSRQMNAPTERAITPLE